MINSVSSPQKDTGVSEHVDSLNTNIFNDFIKFVFEDKSIGEFYFVVDVFVHRSLSNGGIKIWLYGICWLCDN